MKHLLQPLSWQIILFSFAVVVLALTGAPGDDVGGFAVLQADDTDQFAPPYDAFTDDNIISLQHQRVDNDTFHVEADIGMDNSYIYTNVYYYTVDGWEQVTLSGNNDWIKNAASVGIEDLYANIPLREGDDFFLGVWVCKGVDDEWWCGCKAPDDCGHWHLQGIDLEAEGQTPVDCVDADGDGYGVAGQDQCFMNETDCDDADATVNPGETEIAYNGVDDDCDEGTPDDDLDGDGFLNSSDCDDTAAGINPVAVEICDDGVDQDCSGTDEACGQCGEGAVPSTGCVCADQSRWTGFCCDNQYQETPCGTPEVIFYDGFESGTGNTWQYLNPNSRVNNDVPQSGVFSLNLIYSSGGELKTNQYAETVLVEEQRLFYRYYMNFEEDFMHGTAGVMMSSFGRSGWSVEQSARRWQGDASQGRLFVRIDGIEFSTDQVFQNGVWYCVEEELFADDLGVDNGYVRVWVDESLVLEQTGISFADGELIDYVRQGGRYQDGISDTLHVYVDNVVVSRQRVGC
ncbi:putative metal-binding motif-containing protein [Candidatus Woesearchaeota archaeon]|nr:putative metal-binding motif-containing protein [Candidatus Woesearchaeota archaeon]